MKPPSSQQTTYLGTGLMESSCRQSTAQACLLFYQDPARQHLGATREHLTILAQKLCQSAGASVKRCKDRSLEEALEFLQRVRLSLADLDDEDCLPLFHCLLVMQLDSANSSGTFNKLEKIISHISKGSESLVSREVERLMTSLLEGREVLTTGNLQAVCVFLEESGHGRPYWIQNLPTLLCKVASTLENVLADEVASIGDWAYFTIKLCLQIFQGMQALIAPLVWTKTENCAVLQRIVVSLVQAVLMKSVPRDTRLLAGTAISMLTNTCPEPKLGASAMLNLFKLMEAGVGELEFGKLTVEISSPNSDGLEKMALAWGLVSCGRSDVLLIELNCSGNKACLLIDILFPMVSALCKENTKWHYHCVQVFSLWLQRVQETAPQIRKVQNTGLFHQNSELLQNVTHLLWTIAEKPAEGTSEFVLRSFHHFLKAYNLESELLEDDKRTLYKEFLLRVSAIPWQVKARYVPLCALLHYAGPDLVLELYGGLQQDILNCLSTNYLGPVAADVYKIALQLQRRQWAELAAEASEFELAEKWARCWLALLARALTSPDPLLQRNTANHLLKQTLRTFPDSYSLLTQEFQGSGTAALCAWVTVLNAVKMTSGAMPSDKPALEQLALCIHSADEAVRLAAIGLLCCSPKTSQPLSETEIRLLEECLPLSLNSDSSGFRQHLQASLKKALVRLRDSCLASLRTRKGKAFREGFGCTASTFSQGIEFVEWLTKLTVGSLRPGSNFQRKKTSLLLLSAVLETCTDTWSPERRKGQPPQDMAELVSFARQRGCWDFCSRANLLALVSCLSDCTNEIRELAAELLLQYFSESFPECLTVAIFEHAQDMIGSPRVHEAEAGAGIMKTVMQRSSTSILRRLFPKEKQPLVLQCPALCYVRRLLLVLQDYFAKAQQDLLQAAASKPMHGVILAIRQCLLEVPLVLDSLQNLQFRQHWIDLLQNLVTTLRDIGIFLLQVLYGRGEEPSDKPAAAPSFADMGHAINSLIQQGKGLDHTQEMDEEDAVLLSEEHSLILTCCWVSLKEIGILLGSLVHKMLSLDLPADAEPLLPEERLETVAGLFRSILLQCRHWGAVEGCSLGFTRFCSALLSCPDPGLRWIPQRMLAEALDLLQEQRPSSVTRRAAGFPMLILGIVAGEDVSTSRPLLTHCMETSLELASKPLPPNWDDTVDLPQVSAVHVLQTLVRSSSLGSAVLSFVTPMVVLCLRALVSPCWAMRNAAVQLFGALTSRTLGQKRSWGESCAQNAVTPQVFFTQFPELKEVLLQELNIALVMSSSHATGRVRLCHSLHSTLTLLSHLQPANHDVSSSSSFFAEPLFQLAGNPIFAVRVMAAQALVPAVPVTDYRYLLLRLVEDLPCESSGISHNYLHGRLLQINAVLTQALAANSLSVDALQSVACGMERQFWMVTPAQHCPLIRSTYLSTVSHLTASLSQDFRQHIVEAVIAEVSNSALKQQSSSSPVHVGLVALHQVIAHYLCNEAASSSDTKRHAQVGWLLTESDPEVRVSVLKWMTEQDIQKMDTAFVKCIRRMLQENLQLVLASEKKPQALKFFFQAYVCLHQQPSPLEHSFTPEGSVAESTSSLLNDIETGADGPNLLDNKLCVTSLLLVHGSDLDDCSLLDRWCRMLAKYSDPVSSEVLRLAVARSLKLTGSDLVQRALSTAQQSLQSLVVKLFSVGLQLLQDEDQAVRQEAEGFASLVWGVVRADTPTVSIHSNKALQCLLQLLLERFWSCSETFSALLQHLPSTDLEKALEELQLDRVPSLYEQDEPNVFSEPAIVCRLLRPFLLLLLTKMAESPAHHWRVERWVRESESRIASDLQRCQQWCNQDFPIDRYFIKALGCPKVHTSLTVLLTKAELLIHGLEVLEGTQSSSSIYTSQELARKLDVIQELLAHNGMTSPLTKIT